MEGYCIIYNVFSYAAVTNNPKHLSGFLQVSFIFSNGTCPSKVSCDSAQYRPDSRTQADGAVSIWTLLCFWQGEKRHFKPQAGSENHCVEVTHTIAAHMLLAKESHMASSAFNKEGITTQSVYQEKHHRETNSTIYYGSRGGFIWEVICP